MQTYHNFSKIAIPFAMKNTNVNSKSIEHRQDIDYIILRSACKALPCSSLDSISSSKSSECPNYIVPGFNPIRSGGGGA